jgi:hypothetical protein
MKGCLEMDCCKGVLKWIVSRGWSLLDLKFIKFYPQKKLPDIVVTTELFSLEYLEFQVINMTYVYVQFKAYGNKMSTLRCGIFS